MWLDVRVHIAALSLLVSACGGGAEPTDTSTAESPPTSTAPETTASPTTPAAPPTPASPTTPAAPPTTASPTTTAPEDPTSSASTSMPTAESSLEITGVIRTGDEQAAPDEGIVVVTWVVSAGDDYLFVHGTGTQRGDEFTVRFEGPPPAEALNNATLGVGLVLLVPIDAEVPAGRLAGYEPLEDGVLDVIGAAGLYAVVYRADGDSGPDWVEAFPPGYSCGRGVAAAAPQDFESFEPVDCSAIVLDIGELESIEFVNWT